VKVMRIITRLNIGGPTRHAALLNEGLKKEGIRTLFVSGSVGKEEGDMSYLFKENQKSFRTLPELRREINPFLDIVCLWKLFQIMRRERPDIVHTHMAKAGALGRLAAVLARVPVRVHTFHGHVFEGYFRSLATRCFLAVERFLAKRSTCLVAVSDHVRKEICERYRIDSGKKVRVIPLGLDLEPFLALNGRQGSLRRELGLSSEARLIGIVGRLVPIKDHAFFLKVAETLSQEGKNIHFVIIGRGEEEPRLKRLVSERGLSSFVTFLGWRKDLAAIYSDLDIVVLTSKNEGTPVSLIEAMASGKAVVATRVGGVPDVVQEGTTGYMVPVGDLRRFVEKMELLLEDDTLRKSLGAAGREWVGERFSGKRLLRDTKKLYEELLSQKKRG